MSVEIVPSDRMKWKGREARDNDLFTIGLDNVPRLEPSKIPEGPATLLDLQAAQIGKATDSVSRGSPSHNVTSSHDFFKSF